MPLPANPQDRRIADWQARGYGHPVRALLSGNPEVRQAGVHKGLAGKLGLLALDLLHAQDVGRILRDEFLNLLGPQADRIDVPGGEVEAACPVSEREVSQGARRGFAHPATRA